MSLCKCNVSSLFSTFVSHAEMNIEEQGVSQHPTQTSKVCGVWDYSEGHIVTCRSVWGGKRSGVDSR